MISILDRYIGRSVAFGFALVMLILVLLTMFLSLVDHLGDVGKANFDFGALIKYVILKEAGAISQIYPTAILLGSLLGMSYLAASSELTVMRVAGLSIWGLIRSSLKTGAVIVLAGVVLAELVVPVTEDMAERHRAESMQKGFYGKTGVWLKRKNENINIAEVLPDNSLRSVRLYEFDDSGQLARMVSADRAVHEGSKWNLYEVWENRITHKSVSSRYFEKQVWDSGVSPEELSIFSVKPDALGMVNLYRYIKYLRESDHGTRPYELALWRKILAPFVAIAMLMLAIPFVFVHQRSGSMGRRIFLGVMVAFAFNLFNYGSQHFALISSLPPALMSLLPLVLILAAAFWLIRRVS